MCWHRQRLIIPEQRAWLPSLTSYSHLRFAYCCKALGYRKISEDNPIVCRKCYNNLPDNCYKRRFNPIRFHFVSDGTIRPRVSCTTCSEPMLTFRTLYECNICRLTHLHFLTTIERIGQDIENLGNPIILYIDGNALS